jgi:hypothetical protein
VFILGSRYFSNSPIYYSRAEKTLKGAILDFVWIMPGNLTETSYLGGIWIEGGIFKCCMALLIANNLVRPNHVEEAPAN